MTENEKAAPGLWVLLSTPVADREAYLPHLDEHLRYIARLDRQGRLFAGGPLVTAEGSRTGRGLIVVIAADADEARALAEADPFHSRDLRHYTLERWMLSEGSALSSAGDTYPGGVSR